jgi:pimeloyl-ACP methyl ester carboxylesterase
MATTIEAEDDFDLARLPNPITAPTLIVAGSEDRFYSEQLFAETERLIPGSRLRVFHGRGHVTATMHKEWGPEIVRFLEGAEAAGVA